MSPPDLILIGAGGHARSCVDTIEQSGQFRIAGLVGMAGEVGGDRFGYPIIGTDTDIAHLAREFESAIVAVGQIKSSDDRRRLFQLIQKHGFHLPTIVSPRAYVSRFAAIGAGTIVMHAAVVNAGAQIGANCIVNSNALIEHDARVGSHCHVSTGAILNGSVSIGDGTFIGSGTIVKEGVVIGNECVVGMGLIVRDDVCASTSFVGLNLS